LTLVSLRWAATQVVAVVAVMAVGVVTAVAVEASLPAILPLSVETDGNDSKDPTPKTIAFSMILIFVLPCIMHMFLLRRDIK